MLAILLKKERVSRSPAPLEAMDTKALRAPMVLRVVVGHQFGRSVRNLDLVRRSCQAYFISVSSVFDLLDWAFSSVSLQSPLLLFVLDL